MSRPSGNDLLIATSLSGGEPLMLTKEQRSRHLYVTGSTGSGKSKFLEHLIRQDIINWRDSECGLLLLDRTAPFMTGSCSGLPATATSTNAP
jgi:Helicase HerA, central domain